MSDPTQGQHVSKALQGGQEQDNPAKILKFLSVKRMHGDRTTRGSYLLGGAVLAVVVVALARHGSSLLGSRRRARRSEVSGGWKKADCSRRIRAGAPTQIYGTWMPRKRQLRTKFPCHLKAKLVSGAVEWSSRAVWEYTGASYGRPLSLRKQWLLQNRAM